LFTCNEVYFATSQEDILASKCYLTHYTTAFYTNITKLPRQAFSDVIYYFMSTYVLSHTEKLQTHTWLCRNWIERFLFDPACLGNPTLYRESNRTL